MVLRNGAVIRGGGGDQFIRDVAVEDLIGWLTSRVRPFAVEEEWRFHTTRKWLFDYAVPSLKLGIEIQGHGRGGRPCPVCGRSGTSGAGRHGQPGGMENDVQKCGEAQMLGWTVLLLTHKAVQQGDGQRWLEAIITRLKTA